MGAAVATVIGYFCSILYFLWLLYKKSRCLSTLSLVLTVVLYLFASPLMGAFVKDAAMMATGGLRCSDGRRPSQYLQVSC